MTIWIIQLRTTGEPWHTCVAGSIKGVQQVMKNHGILTRMHGTDESEYQGFYNEKDSTQTASVMRQILIP